MNDLNSVLLEGIVEGDPDFETVGAHNQRCTFAIASERTSGHGDDRVKEVSHFDVETWAKLAETCAVQLKKGSGVRLVGHLRQVEVAKCEDTNERERKVVVVAEHVEFKKAKA